MMKRLLRSFLPVAAGVLLLQPLYSAEQSGQKAAPKAGVREITFVADDGQTRYTSKVFDLKHVAPTDILPFIQGAIMRYSVHSSVQRVTSTDPKAKGALLVSTSPGCMSFVADLIAKIDRPGKADKYGSLIEGTGISRIAYAPKYRAAEDLIKLVNSAFSSSEGKAYLDKDTNTIYWKDEHSNAMATLAWVEYLDKPLPQAQIRLNYYEMRESTLRDIGFDYLAWKNGPGVNLFNVGYNAGKIALDEAFQSALLSGLDLASNFSSSWGYGGFFTAPAFDMSFIRILQQSGSARVAGHATLMVTGTPVDDYQGIAYGRYTYRTSVTPEYVNIQKTEEGRSYVSYPGATAEAYAASENGETVEDPDYENPSKNSFTVYNPIICFAGNTGTVLSPADKKKNAFYDGKEGGVIFTYSATFGNVVERSDTGAELANNTTVDGSATLAFGTEKLLTVFEKESDVEQYIGLPFFHKIPILKYLFGTTTTVVEHTYVVVTAEVTLISLDGKDKKPVSHELQAKESQRFEIFKDKSHPDMEDK